jgi:type I restriction enzyme S subunit
MLIHDISSGTAPDRAGDPAGDRGAGGDVVMSAHMVPIGEVVDFIGGGTPSRDVDHYWNGSIPWASVKDFKGSSIDSTLESITHDGLSASSSALIHAGHVIMPTRMALGKAAINSIDVAINQDLKALKPKTSIDTRYLLHAILSRAKEIQSHGKGATVQGITIERLRAIQIPLPPLEEQRRIAAILDKAQDIKALCDKAEKLSEIADRSLFLHYFAEQPGSNEITLQDIIDRKANAIRTGPFGSQLLHSEFTEAGIAVLGIDNAVTNNFTWGKRRYISEEKYRQLERYTVFPGDLLITIMGTCGRVAVVPDDIPTAINTKHLCSISVNQDAILPDYLHDYMLYHPFAVKYLARQTKGAIMEGLNMSIIKQIPVFLPPLEKQLKWHFRRRLSRAIASKNRQRQGSLSHLASSLNQILLNGCSS